MLGLSASVAAADWIRCERLFEAERGRIVGPRWIEIREGRFGAIVERAPEGVTITRDVVGGTCLPGLIDLHTHLTAQPSRDSYSEGFRMNPADYALRAQANARITLLAGFTTIRDLGDHGKIVASVRDAVQQGLVIGPRIYTSTKSIATTGGHADPTNGRNLDLTGDPGPRDGVINGPQEAREAVRQRYKDGADLIKITATGGVLSLAKSGLNPQFTADDLAAVVETARDYGFVVAAHAHGKEGMKRAILAGVDTIEHGSFMDEELFTLMKQRGTWHVPTLMAGWWVAEKAKEEGFYPPLVRAKAAAIGPKMQETLAKSYRAGVKIAFGTDSGVFPHGMNAKEFELMVRAGIPPAEALRMATVHAAEVLRESESLGSIAAGKWADLVVVDGDPLADVTRMQQVRWVMKGGRIYDPEQVRALYP
jgi:imidazolonepropionase-like amidohydrolase